MNPIAFLLINIFAGWLSMGLVLLLALYDHLKRRPVNGYPFASFIVPVYNDAHYVSKTIESIFASYPRERCEVFVVNDCSTDDTPQVLRALAQQQRITVRHNAQNKGKAISINETFPHTKGELIFTIDADMVLNKTSVDDLVSRMEHPKMGAASCRYKSVDTGNFHLLQGTEFSYTSLFLCAQNPYSAVSLWGGCTIVRRKAFADVGLLTERAILEDNDLALKLVQAGWRIGQSLRYARTHPGQTMHSVYEKKVLTGKGAGQSFIYFWRVYLSNPVLLLFLLLSILPLVYSVYIATSHSSFATSSTLYAIALYAISILVMYPLGFLPALLLSVDTRNVFRIIGLLYTYAFFYMPLAGVVYIPAFVRGAYDALFHKEPKVGWRGITT